MGGLPLRLLCLPCPYFLYFVDPDIDRFLRQRAASQCARARVQLPQPPRVLAVAAVSLARDQQPATKGPVAPPCLQLTDERVVPVAVMGLVRWR